MIDLINDLDFHLRPIMDQRMERNKRDKTAHATPEATRGRDVRPFGHIQSKSMLACLRTAQERSLRRKGLSNLASYSEITTSKPAWDESSSVFLLAFIRS